MCTRESRRQTIVSLLQRPKSFMQEAAKRAENMQDSRVGGAGRQIRRMGVREREGGGGGSQ